MFESTPAHTESPTPLVHTRAPRTLKHSVVCDFQVSDEGNAYARASARPRTPKQCVTRLLICYFRVHTRAHKVPYSVSVHPRTAHLKAECRMRLCTSSKRCRHRLCQCAPAHTHRSSVLRDFQVTEGSACSKAHPRTQSPLLR